MKFGKVAFAAFLIVIPAAANAVTIDFEGLTDSNGSAFSTYSQDGFTVASTAVNYLVGDASLESPTKHLIGGLYNTTVNGRLTVTGFSSFTFNSIDYTGLTGCATNCQNQLTFTGYLNNAQIYTESRSLPDYQSSDYLSIAGVSGTIDQLVIDTSGFLINLDNINVTPAGTAAVPESSTWAMMLVGFVAIGGTMRRRRQAGVRLA